MIGEETAMPGTGSTPRDVELLSFWRCGVISHGHCFSANHRSANRVAWEGNQHDRSCGCWQHAVLRAIGWPTVTGQPGSPHAVFEDASLPHQIVLLFAGSAISVTCNCLGGRAYAGRGQTRRVIETRKEFPAGQAILAHRDWHRARGLAVTAKLP